MQSHIISGIITLPKTRKQRQLHNQLSGFAEWMQRNKDTAEIRKDKQQSVPIAMLPLIF